MEIVTTLPAFLWVNISVLNVVSYGLNSYRPGTGRTTVHAEASAIQKLPIRKNKKLKKINILVIKTSPTGKLGNSKPCYKCLMDLSSKPHLKGYRIDTVFYTNENGEIDSQKLKNLISEGNYHLSAYYRNTNFKIQNRTV